MFFVHFDTEPENVQMFDSGWGDEKYYYDEDGNMFHHPRRTKMSHPYSYDPIVLFDTGTKPNGGAYSDRMHQWDAEKFRKTIGEMNNGKGEMSFSWHDKSKVEKFCRAYFDDPTMKIVKVVEQCNQSTGYPLWYISWQKAEDTNKGN